jgi:hypothetical protein
MTTTPIARENWAHDDLIGAIEIISARVDVVHLTHESAEFLAKGTWVEIQKIPNAWRVRVYKGWNTFEQRAPNANEAVEAARMMVLSTMKAAK